jgi:tetratricopeptide (TPR) repeat protein
LNNPLKVYKKNLAGTANNLMALGKKQVQLKKYAEAKGIFLKAIGLKSDSGIAHNELGKIYLQLNSPKDALTSFMRAIECQPSYAEPYFNLGLELFKSHQYLVVFQ